MSEQSRKKILDYGYLEVIETWGSDERIIEAARMSTGKGFQGWSRYICNCERSGEVEDVEPDLMQAWEAAGRPADVELRGIWYRNIRHIEGDERLLAYLYRNKHATPFEMAGMVIEVQAPIFVFREWHRHRTQSYNELSARYTPMPDLSYLPDAERVMLQGGTNKQAQSIADKVLTEDKARHWISKLGAFYAEAQAMYEEGLGLGVPKELARLCVPVGRYSRMRASANLRNWLAFLTLRMDPAAQWEIRQYANAVGEAISAAFPRTWALFVEGRAK